MKVLFLEPFFGGSHKDFALGFTQYSRHKVTLVTLADRFWKWRMRGSSCYFVNKVKNFSDYDIIITTDMLNLTDLKSLGGKNFPPVLIYFHENQLSYPLAPGSKRDLDLGLTNIISAVVADKVLFNSKFHYNDFINAATNLIMQTPDAKPEWMVEQIKIKAQIVYPGCQFKTGYQFKTSCQFKTGTTDLKEKNIKKPLIIWNHRWDHDKNFNLFFDVLCSLKEKKIAFSLALLGERFANYPAVFKKARDIFKKEILIFDYLESKEQYKAWIEKGAIVVSCAIQENFGISIVEAVRHGCIPLLPDRLSYPELIPENFHSKVLYKSKKDFEKKLEEMIINFQTYLPLQKKLSLHMEQFSWEIMVKQYDDILEKMKKEYEIKKDTSYFEPCYIIN